MAFNKTGFAHLVHGKEGFSPGIYTYQSDDAIATIGASGYFDNGATVNTGMRQILRKNDVLLITALASGASTVQWRKVTSIAGGIITIAALDA